jgi:hypothetical protein
MELKFTSIGLILIIVLIYFNNFFLAGITALILLISALNDVLIPSKKSDFLKKEIDKELKTINDNAGKHYPHEGIKSIASDAIQGTTNNIYGNNQQAGKPLIGEPFGFLGQASENFLNGLKSLFKK